jgi:hypothetical protein
VPNIESGLCVGGNFGDQKIQKLFFHFLKNHQLAKEIAIKKLVDFCALSSLAHHGHDTWLMPHVPFWTLRLRLNWPLITPN